MKITIELITPDIARDMLGHNTANRGLRKHRVLSYADQMAREQWLETGDPIKFTKDGTLVDGQHRLAAVIESGVSVKMAVARGVPDASYRVIDSGLSRQPGDALGADVANVGAKAAAARLLYVIECDGDPRKTQDMTAVTRTDISEYYEEHHEQIDAAQPLAWVLNRQSGGMKAAWITFVVLARRINPVWADEFCEGVRTGANLTQGDPRLALRNWFVRNNKIRNNGGQVGLFIKAWNAWLMGATRQYVALRDDEEYPTLGHRRKHPKEVS